MSTQAEHPVRQILRRALQLEEDSYNLYKNAAQAAKSPHSKQLLKDLAQEEMGHQKRLQDMITGNPERIVAPGQEQKIVDLKIGDYLVAPALSPDSDFQDVLIVASKREQSAHEFYQAMADLTCGLEERKLFLVLAEEEIKHKALVESIYEQTVYKDF